MPPSDEQDAASARAARLAAALRENLKRRKVQAKGRGPAADDTALTAEHVTSATPDATQQPDGEPSDATRVVSPGHKR